jgi:hypothetical protein
MKDKNDEWLSLSHPATKTNANEVQAMPATVGIYDKLVKQLKSDKKSVTPNDYLFFPDIENRDFAMEVISRQFKKIVDASEIEEKTSKTIVLYSLRHTAIMFRLIIGSVDTLVLSRNARTSQSMIDRFYAAHLTTDQVRRQLHYIPRAEDEEDDRKDSAKSVKQSDPQTETKSDEKSEKLKKSTSRSRSQSPKSSSDTLKTTQNSSKSVRKPRQ